VEVTLSVAKTITEDKLIVIDSSILAGLKHGGVACLHASAPLNSTICHHWGEGKGDDGLTDSCRDGWMDESENSGF